MALGPCGCTDYHLADCPTRQIHETLDQFEELYSDSQDPDYDFLRDDVDIEDEDDD